MDSEKVFLTVRDICSEILGVQPQTVTPSASLRDKLGADSLDFAELLMALEDWTRVSIPQGALKDVKCVEDVVALVMQYAPSAAS